VSVMLFQGWSIDNIGRGGGNPWLSHPYNGANNINGVNGDINGDNQGPETHTLGNPANTYQKTLVRKYIDTLNDLDNVLWEITNEDNVDSTAWQYDMINYIKQYEAGKPARHPVGMSGYLLFNNAPL